jgi:hypothetical protein
MFNTGCLADTTYNSYCYVSAVANPNPADVYFYQLPLGIGLPKNTKLTCSDCTKSLLTLYEAALGNGAELVGLSGLRSTYASAANLAGTQCGQGYAISSVATGWAVGFHTTGFGLTLVRVLGSVAVVALGWLSLH